MLVKLPCPHGDWVIPDEDTTPLVARVRALLRARTLKGFLHEGPGYVCRFRLEYVDDERYVIAHRVDGEDGR